MSGVLRKRLGFEDGLGINIRLFDMHPTHVLFK